MAARWCQSCSLLFSVVFYCRSQKTAQFQKQSGLNGQLSGMSSTGLAAGPVRCLFLCVSKNNTEVKNELALKYTNYVCEQVKKST